MSKLFVRTAFLTSLSLVFPLILGVSAVSGKAHAMTLGQVAQIARTATPAAFNAVEFTAPQQAESHVSQWNRAKADLSRDMLVLQNCLQAEASCTNAALKNWRQMMIQARDADESKRLNMVNSFFNQWSYISDQENYGVSEYWAAPLDFMSKGGDCEDFAIAKYASLQLLGYADQSMRVMAVMDTSRDGMGHAVLSVKTRAGDMILDNRSTIVYGGAQQTAYVPRFGVNMSGVYTYSAQPRVMMASAY